MTDELGNQNNVLLVGTASTSDTKDEENGSGHTTTAIIRDEHTSDSTHHHSRKHCHIVGHFNPNCSTKGISACDREKQAREDNGDQSISTEQIDMVKQALSTPTIQEAPLNDHSDLDQLDDVSGPATQRPMLGHAPTFSYEALGHSKEEEPSYSPNVPSLDGLDDSLASNESSPIEEFPQDRRGILERINTTKLLLEPDEAIASTNAPQPLPLDASDVSPKFPYEHQAVKLPCTSHEGYMDESDMETSLDSSVPQIAGLSTIASSVGPAEEKQTAFHKSDADSHEFLLGYDGASSRRSWSRAASTNSVTTAASEDTVIENDGGESLWGNFWRRIAEWFNSIYYSLFVNKEA